jgi:hypothetical protein
MEVDYMALKGKWVDRRNDEDFVSAEDINAVANAVIELEDNKQNNGGASIELDTTLTQEGKAADAKAVGDALKAIENQPGASGEDGITPHIGYNGNWYIGEQDTGVKARGEDGQQGPKGDKGDKGDTGAQGPKGDTGATGGKGADGTSVTVKSVSESTADGGSNVVTFSDGKTLTVKNGSKGSTGSKGDKGDKGDTGATGAAGKNGADGYTPVRGTDYWTEADKVEIVQRVIETLGGNPIFGIVDENNNIVVSGDLPDVVGIIYALSLCDRHDQPCRVVV